MRKLVAVLTACLVLSASLAPAQARRVIRRGPGEGSPAPASRLSDRQKAAVLDSLAGAIHEVYLHPGQVDSILEHLEAETASGAWDGADGPEPFARAVTLSLREFTGDLHFAVRYDPARAGRLESAMEDDGEGGERAVRMGFGSGLEPPPPGSPMHQAMVERFAPRNFSMTKLEVLDGNVGYFRLEMFPPLALARETLDAAMTFLAHADALIIDLRGTPGGVGGFLPYLASYFFDGGGKLLYSRRWGAEGRTEEYATHDEIGGDRRPGVPLYILTDSLTGSAAENFAYTMKHHGRATLVGETTIGGGHSARGLPLAEGFIASVPAAEVIHPVTGKGFDTVGVRPDVDAPGPGTLGTAHALAVTRLMEEAPPERRAGLERVLREIETSHRAAGPSAAAGPDLEELAGRYGARTISVAHGTLRYQREGGPRLVLERLDGDTFRMDLPRGVRAVNPLPDVRFERDDSGAVTGFSLVRPDGSVEEFVPRDS